MLRIRGEIMLELALKGGNRYWGWIAGILTVIGAGLACYSWQLEVGLGLTGLSRDVSWGFYVAQLTFLVGVAASAVMLVLPYYLHDFKAFGKITIIGEFVAVATICMCLLFLFVDLGQPARALNIFLYPTPRSVIFWDAMVLGGYLMLNIVVGWQVLEAQRNSVAPPAWVRPLIYLSIPWAFAIHTVTAFLYCGLPARGFWLTAVLAPRFLASAFSSGPALLIVLCLMIRRLTGFDAGAKAIRALAAIVTYGLFANLFFFGCELFVAFYSRIPEHMEHFRYLFAGIEGHTGLVPWMWLSMGLLGMAGVLLLIPGTRKNEAILTLCCLAVFSGTWIDKGLGLVSGGFIPSPLHHVTEYAPTLPELVISSGVYGVGALLVTILLKVAIGVKQE
jgi:Ni/Fe-hydrogenase subunit HybB-like protein